MILFTYLKIILLRYFQFSVSAKISCIQTDLKCFLFQLRKATSFLNKLPVVFYTYMIAHISYDNFFFYHYMHHLLHEKKYLMRRSNETRGVKWVDLSGLGVDIIELSI